MKLNAPRHIELRRYRTTPAYMQDFQEIMQQLVWRINEQVQEVTDSSGRLIESAYSTGFDDGYAAALLQKDASESPPR
jgi:hypothetical protein